MPELKLAENAHTNSHNTSVTQQHSPSWTWRTCGIICICILYFIFYSIL